MYGVTAAVAMGIFKIRTLHMVHTPHIISATHHTEHSEHAANAMLPMRMGSIVCAAHAMRATDANPALYTVDVQWTLHSLHIWRVFCALRMPRPG